MKAFSYFFILVLAAFLGKKYIGIASVYLWVFILSNFGAPPSTISTIVAYTFYIISFLFVLILLFRIFLCIKHRHIIIPDQYTNGFQTAGKITVTLFCFTILLTFFSAYTAFDGMFGIPLGMILLPIGLTSMIITLHCEVPLMQDFIRKGKNK